MDKSKVTNGVWLVRIPEADLCILCGSPPDVVKHMMKRGLLVEVSRGGVVFETGPNAILLSDVTVQGGTFSNLAEFPLLQMFYRQGMTIPGHVNNTGRKPMFIGLSNQLLAQSAYIARGTFGLADEAEIEAAGIKAEVAREIMRVKLRFAFGKPGALEEIADFVSTDSGRAELPGGVTVERKSLNVYEFRRAGESVEVDLNLGPGETYESAVRLDSHRIKLDYFSIVHSGEGNGWDKDRPCMSSIIVFQGRIYLIDTGPDVLNTLTSLGISVNEIEGIFHTHAHDDHFAGLTSLVRTDHRIKYFATPLIRSAVMKKLSAVMSLPEKRFATAFDFHDLSFNRWNDIEGLEVLPVLSLHPVETNILLFRTLWQGGHRTYAHLADIPPFSVLKQYLLDDPERGESSTRLHDVMMKSLLQPVDLKKIDSGGGLIHGRAEDFASDKSKKIILSHTAGELSPAQKEIGSSASFGLQDSLIESNIDYALRHADRYLTEYFPEAARHDIEMLLNCPTAEINAGQVLLKKGAEAEDVFLVINGVLDVVDAKQGVQHMLSAGTIVGETCALSGESSPRTYRARSSIRVLRIPAGLYLEFASRNYDVAELRRTREVTLFLQSTWLFGEMVSSAIHNRIARDVSSRRRAVGEGLSDKGESSLVLVRSGRARVLMEEVEVDLIGPGGVFGEESLFFHRSSLMSAKVTEEGEFLYIPPDALGKVPIVEWKLLETYERRITRFGASRAAP